ncbi:MAG: TadE-like [Frankiales bacterium]|nr:TadE-like [Frankiales bacterium]
MNDDGYATAEAAVALPALLVVLSLALGVLVSVGAQLSCVDAARAAARVAARGEGDVRARQAGQEVAPHGSSVAVEHRGSEVQVTVSGDIRPFRIFPAIHVSARAVAEVEQ